MVFVIAIPLAVICVAIIVVITFFVIAISATVICVTVIVVIAVALLSTGFIYRVIMVTRDITHTDRSCGVGR